MAPCNSRNLKTKEMNISHLTVANRKKMEICDLGVWEASFGTYENLVELVEQKVAVMKYEYRGKPEEWTSDVWREMLNAIFAPVRLEHFQHNLLAFYHYAWAAITNPAIPTPDWGDVVEKTVSRQIKALGVCNEATCIGPYLVHLYSHFHEMDAEEKEDSKKRKALIQTVSDSDTEIEMKYEKEPKEEVPRAFCEGEANRSKPLDQKIDYDEWGIHLESLGHETSKLFEAFHVEVGSVTAEAVARNMKEMFAPPSVAKADIQPLKEMVKNLAKLLTEEQKRNKEIIEQRDYYEGKIWRSEKIPKIAMWPEAAN
ncbi:hypothetical protein R1flu_025842 [Riccia fluitans]|uniref:Aminotransferase-like plant mobile domain-containing protein n=1 Tax=Riccia fluitans TaxID=41844 RepID=A0ABD1XYX0_9MARC